ncbi:MAG: hypothetical protein NT180_06255 [Actinobacteria bacterium]|nr:hypothetical protein [Actinomycetota bacterium]
MKKFLLVVAAAAGAAVGVAIWKRRSQPASNEPNVGSWADSVSAAEVVEVVTPAPEPAPEPAEVPGEEAVVKKPRRKKPAPTPDAEV